MTKQSTPSPSRVAWALRPAVPGAEQRAWQAVFEVLNPDFSVDDTRVTLTGGGSPVSTTRTHRLVDYFAAVTVQLSQRGGLPAYALIFEPDPEADRFWKDVMLKVINRLRSEQVEVLSIAIEPADGAAERWCHWFSSHDSGRAA